MTRGYAIYAIELFDFIVTKLKIKLAVGILDCNLTIEIRFNIFLLDWKKWSIVRIERIDQSYVQRIIFLSDVIFLMSWEC